MLKEAVAENVEIIRGLPPRSVRPAHRFTRIWLRRAPLLLVLFALAASTYRMSSTPTAAPVATAALVAPRAPEARSSEAGFE
ncbi:MAG TPA: hypothetical protein VG106_05870, partial [Vicinamibacterales bacterium]|nr:hypothetical protein [Vicinamibacterales bacterium]